MAWRQSASSAGWRPQLDRDRVAVEADRVELCMLWIGALPC
jgi:hypothetical protein